MELNSLMGIDYRDIKKHFLLLVVLCCVSLMLFGCADKEHKDLKKHVDKVLSRKGGAIEPLPKMETYTPKQYAQAKNRSPFQAPKPKETSKTNNNISPNLKRPKEELEQFSLDSLSMVGVFKLGRQAWALVSAPNGTVYRVRAGSFIGKDYGKVSTITDNELVIVETVSNGKGGWTRRQRELKLESKE